MNKKVYIVQTHENVSEHSDSISVFASLKDAVADYNDRTADFVSEDEIADLEGKDVQREYEGVYGGCVVTTTLFSRNI